MSDTSAAIKELWDNYYAQSGADTILKDANFFRMELAALTRALAAEIERLGERPVTICELGSGTGALAEAMLAGLPAEARARVRYVGVDFSRDACARAEARGIAGARFVAADFLAFLEGETSPFDVIVTQRSVMAVVDEAGQRRLLELMRGALATPGALIMSEGLRQASANLNALRGEVGVEPMEAIWHCLYLDADEVREIFPGIEVEDFSSLYWLITRVVYPFSAEPRHNTPLHDMAASLPQTGDFGLVKLMIARNA